MSADSADWYGGRIVDVDTACFVEMHVTRVRHTSDFDRGGQHKLVDWAKLTRFSMLLDFLMGDVVLRINVTFLEVTVVHQQKC